MRPLSIASPNSKHGNAIVFFARHQTPLVTDEIDRPGKQQHEQRPKAMPRSTHPIQRRDGPGTGNDQRKVAYQRHQSKQHFGRVIPQPGAC